MDYKRFIDSKMHSMEMYGFEPIFMPSFLMDFQKYIVEWATQKGRCAIFADCGMGKTPMQLVWAQNIVEKTNGRVLVLTPLAVGAQTKREGDKFGIEVNYERHGKLNGKIIVTNYEQLHRFNASDFTGCVCDESSILKNYNGKYKAAITEFMRKMSYRLLCTATAAPNDYVELGTSSEALGELGFTDVLTRFFKSTQTPTCDTRRRYAIGGVLPKFVFKRHAEEPFWKWVCSWARAVRKPSDIGFSDGDFILPVLKEINHVMNVSTPRDGALFAVPAHGLYEQRKERKLTINDRCEMAAELSNKQDVSISWCHLNTEGDLLEKLISGCVQVCGSQSDEDKEEKLMAFLSGEARALVTKPMCAGFGLNMQHCSHMTFFPSHSYEQYYQSIRRCWRFGQKKPVTVDIVTTEGEQNVMKNLHRKAQTADEMFTKLVHFMSDALHIDKTKEFTKKQEVPEWLLKTKLSQSSTQSITETV